MSSSSQTDKAMYGFLNITQLMEEACDGRLTLLPPEEVRQTDEWYLTEHNRDSFSTADSYLQYPITCLRKVAVVLRALSEQASAASTKMRKTNTPRRQPRLNPYTDIEHNTAQAVQLAIVQMLVDVSSKARQLADEDSQYLTHVDRSAYAESHDLAAAKIGHALKDAREMYVLFADLGVSWHVKSGRCSDTECGTGRLLEHIRQIAATYHGEDLGQSDASCQARADAWGKAINSIRLLANSTSESDDKLGELADQFEKSLRLTPTLLREVMRAKRVKEAT
ncbi:hypothetical protein Q5752_005176 [Cryptotrichosporon argae]